jgi:DHA2 family multidrug resistance protein
VSAGAIAADRPAVPVVNPWIVATAVMFATFMEILDTTVVNVSLPHIAGSLSASIDESTWALTSYLVANAIVLPLTGWLANYFGRKRLLLLSISGFTMASLLCGLAPTLSALVVFRVMQGLSGGALQPLSQAVLLEAFPPRDRGKAMGFWGLGIVVAPILGPVVGGWLTDSYSWRWVFYINLPVGLASVVMAKLFIFDPPYVSRKSESVDYWGIGLLAVGIGALQILLDLGSQHDWFASNFIQVLAGLAVVGLAVFIWHELHTDHPVVDLRVSRAHVQHGRLPDDGARVRAVRQPRAAADHAADPLGYPSLQAGIAMLRAGWDRSSPCPSWACSWPRWTRGSSWPGICGGALTCTGWGTSPLRGLLGRLLAAVHPRHVAWAHLRAPHHHQHGSDPQGDDGQRHEPVQPDAEHRGQRGHRAVHHDALAAGPGQHRVPRLPRHDLRRQGHGDARRASQLPGRARDGRGHGHEAGPGHGLRPVARQATMLAFVGVFRLLAIIFILMPPLLLLMRPPCHRRGRGHALTNGPDRSAPVRDNSPSGPGRTAVR